jgi:hypothetical protein
MKSGSICLGLGLGMIALSIPASAYVRTRTPGGTAIYWPSSCVYVQPDIAGTPDLPAADLFEAVQRSMDAWSSRTDCGYIELRKNDPAASEAHFDGVNVVKFRRDRWCHPDDAQTHDLCYDPQAAAITTVFYTDHPGNSDDGQILDADIELNEINFTSAILQSGTAPPDPRPGTALSDFENTLVHELGHLQGLDHTCRDGSTNTTVRDENGDVPPSCTQLGSLDAPTRMKITEATMFNFAGPGEIKKRTPEDDDVAGVCAAYPLASDPKLCDRSPGDDHGCSMNPGAASGHPSPLLPFLLCLAFYMIRRQPAV